MKILLQKSKTLITKNFFSRSFNTVSTKINFIYGLQIEIIDNSIHLIYPELTPLEIYASITNILDDLKRIHTKGFLNNINLSSFPVIKTFFEALIDLSVVENIESIYDKKGNFIARGNSKIYHWIYNTILILLYELTLNVINKMKLEDHLIESEIYFDFINMSKNIYNKIDPSIRKLLQKRGISLTQNIQTGFDTEYIYKKPKLNKILSVQLAINTQSYLKLPLIKEFEISGINTLSNESYKKSPNFNIEGFSVGIIETTIQLSIKRIRDLKYKDYDSDIEKIVEGLKRLSVLKYFIEEDFIIFKLVQTPTKEYFQFTDDKGFTLKEIIKISNILGNPSIENTFKSLLNILQKLFCDLELDEKLLIQNDNCEQYDELNLPGECINIKQNTRSFYQSFSKEKLSLTRYKNNIFIAHLTTADLSILNDFNDFKDFLDIVNKCFVTIAKPFIYENSRVVIRDTMLLSPAGQKSLSFIGKLYKLDKKELTIEEIQNMDVLKIKDPLKFKEYAMRDALITLTHACWMENFYFGLHGVGIPLTLSGIGNQYVKINWKNLNYEGFQINSEYLIGDAPSIQTPVGLNMVGDLSHKLSLYIGNYKGGRNESFMYGIDTETFWYDYDLTSAYTTVLYNAGDPDYASAKILTVEELLQKSDDDLINSYTIIKCQFNFPDHVKYPSIPVYMNESSTVYPLSGSAILTGIEYILARNQNCKFTFEEIFVVPFTEDCFPFKSIIKEIQGERRKHQKGSISNLMYKEIGNSIYGSLVRGMNDKQKYDNKTGEMIRIKSHFLTNPLIASWVTSYIRSLVGECLHGINLNGGKAVSVTTDGFITDIDGLENILCENTLLKSFKNIRFEITENNNEGLEIKSQGQGIISWCTRGQLGISSQIKATTGFQSRSYTREELVELFMKSLNSDDKSLDYIQSSLRSANAISKHGGHVTMIYRDQKFNLKYDNRRLIISEDLINKSIDDDLVLTSQKNPSMTLLDSKPVETAVIARDLREISSKERVNPYNQRTSLTTKNTYKDYTDLAIRNFIKGLLSNPPMMPLISNELKSYNSIIEFIKGYDSKYKVTKQSISNLKNRKIIFKQLPLTKDTKRFDDYLKSQFPKINESIFFNS